MIFVIGGTWPSSLNICPLNLLQSQNDKNIHYSGNFKLLCPSAATVCCGLRPQPLTGNREATHGQKQSQFVVGNGHNIWEVTVGENIWQPYPGN